jgi:hypothetical protein
MDLRKHVGSVLTGLVSLLVAGGCESLNNTDRGILTGAGLGAVAGGLVGAAAGRPAAGAAIGAGLGGIAGGATGAAIDNSERRIQAQMAAAQRPPLSLQEVVELTTSGASDAVIINQIRNSGSVYQLTAQDIIWLQNSGVREPVIREMQATAYRPVRQVYTAVPVSPVYVVSPLPPPVGVGFHFGRCCR